jgi:hypothetical protein
MTCPLLKWIGHEKKVNQQFGRSTAREFSGLPAAYCSFLGVFQALGNPLQYGGFLQF